jgi:hypothetical protein
VALLVMDLPPKALVRFSIEANPKVPAPGSGRNPFVDFMHLLRVKIPQDAPHFRCSATNQLQGAIRTFPRFRIHPGRILSPVKVHDSGRVRLTNRVMS